MLFFMFSGKEGWGYQMWHGFIPACRFPIFCQGLGAQFLGFKRKPSGKLDTHSAGSGVWSDWPDLNDLCIQTGVSLDWVRTDSESVRVSEDIITDPQTYVRARVTYGGDSHPLTSAGARRTLSDLHQSNTGLDWNFRENLHVFPLLIILYHIHFWRIQ